MAEKVMAAPRFESLLSSTTDKVGKSIVLTFLGADQKKYELRISANCAPVAISALAAHLGEILSTLPEEDHPPMQPILVKGVQPAMRDSGPLALMFVLETGAELPLEFPREDLATLSAQFADLAKLADRGSHH